MKLNRLEALHFHDRWLKERAKHVSGITGMIGESLGSALVEHCLIKQGYSVTFLDGTPTTREKPNKWLDRWMLVEKDGIKSLYQVEIKNWSAYSKEGDDTTLDLNDEAYGKNSVKRWNRVFTGTKITDEQVAKVLRWMMHSDPAYEKLPRRAMACFWGCMHPNGKRLAHFTVPVDPTDQGITDLEVFSMSAYLRSLPDEFIELHLPHVEERLRLLSTFLSA